MGISNLIRQQKEKFFAAKDKFDRGRIIAETEKLNRAKEREAELAKLNAQKQIAARDLAAIKGYNEKVAGPSKVQRFAKGLAKAVNQGRKSLQANQVKLNKGNFLNASPGGRGPFATNPSGGNPFNLGPSKKAEPKQRKKVIKIEI